MQLTCDAIEKVALRVVTLTFLAMLYRDISP